MDDNMDNTTVVTSEHSYCGALPERYNVASSSAKTKSSNRSFSCGLIFLVRFIFGSIIIFSPISMVILPFVLSFLGHGNIEMECSADCEVDCYTFYLTKLFRLAFYMS
jgi:hypothetical protein